MLPCVVGLVCFRFFYVLAFEDGEETGGVVALLFLFFEGGFVFCAVILGSGAAGVEGAALRGVGWGGHIAGEDDAPAFAFLVGVRNGDGREQGGCVGVTRL